MLRTKDFRVFYEKKVLEDFTNFELEISKMAMELLKIIYLPDTVYRSCGVTLENIDYTKENQLNLFATENGKNFEKLADAIDKLESKFGKNVIKTGFFEEDF